MELKDFVRKCTDQVIDGVLDAQKKLRNECGDAYYLQPTLKDAHINFEFDLSVYIDKNLDIQVTSNEDVNDENIHIQMIKVCVPLYIGRMTRSGTRI